MTDLAHASTIPPARPPRSPAPGVALTLWTGGDLSRVLTPRARRLLDEARPPIVCVHAGPDRLLGAAAKIVEDARKIHPHVRVHVGIGCDVWIGRAIAGQCSIDHAAEKLAEGADVAAEVGAEAVIWDAEAACKLDSRVTALIAHDLIGTVRVRHPYLLQGHTAYDHPTLHSDDVDGIYDDGHVRGEYAWRAWCASAGVDFGVWQNYVAPAQAEDGGPGVFAGRGALAARVRSSDASVRAAVAKGWIRGDLASARYFQLHHTPWVQLAAAALEPRLVYGWCGPELPVGRMDASGEWAFRAWCALDAAGVRARDTIERVQRAHGLTVDGVPGRDTLRALGLEVPEGVR